MTHGILFVKGKNHFYITFRKYEYVTL